MRHIVNLRAGADLPNCVTRLAEFGPVSDCGSGRTCHLRFVEIDAADLGALSKVLGADLVSIAPAATPGRLRQQITDPGLWALDFIDGTEDGKYSFVADGAGVTILSVDAPAFDNADFGGRFQALAPQFPAGGVNHGTNTMTAAGGALHGAAKGALLRNFAGFDGNGAGTAETVNLAWTALNDYAEDNNIAPAVAYFSFTFTGLFANLFDANLARSRALGVVPVVAAGNAGIDPANDPFANVWPAQDPNAFTIGAHDDQGAIAPFSNFGSMVDLYAPGVNVLVGEPDGTSKLDGGTSFSAPYAAGLIARLIELDEAEPEQWLLNNARTINGLLVAAMPAAGSVLEPIRFDGGSPFNRPDGRLHVGGAVPSSTFAAHNRVDGGAVA